MGSIKDPYWHNVVGARIRHIEKAKKAAERARLAGGMEGWTEDLGNRVPC